MATFTRRTRTFDASDRPTETITTIDGEAIFVRGKPLTYQRLGLVESAAPTILFSPTLYTLHAWTPEFVLPGDTIVVDGVTLTAKDVAPVAPDGVVILARIVVTK